MGQMIGQCRPTAWLAPSHDLNLQDFYFWGHIKTTVYATEVSDVRIFNYEHRMNLS